MSKRLRQQLKGLRVSSDKINPDLEWVKKNKSELFDSLSFGNENNIKIKNNLFVKKVNDFLNIFVPESLVLYGRPVFASVLAFGIVIGGWIAGVNASQNSLPGDVLWGVKLAGEKTQLVLVSVSGDSGEKEAELYLKFAGKRANEIKQVVDTKENIGKSVNTAVESLKKSIDSANKTIEKVVTKDNGNAVSLVNKTDKKVEEILGVLEETKDAVKGDANKSGNKDVIDQVSNAVKAVETAGIKSVELLVNKSTEVKEGEEIDAELKNTAAEKVTKKLASIETDFVSIKKDFDELDNLFVSSTAFAVNSPATSTSAETASSTLILDENTTSTQDLAVLIQNLQTKITESESFVSSTLVEAGGMVSSGDLTNAFEKAKILSELISELKKMLEDILVLMPRQETSPEGEGAQEETNVSTSTANIENSTTSTKEIEHTE